MINLLKESFPRSAHKFDEAFDKYIGTQLLRWTAGALVWFPKVEMGTRARPGQRLINAYLLLGEGREGASIDENSSSEPA